MRISAASVALRMYLRSRIENGPRLNSTFSRPRNRFDGTSRSSAQRQVLEHGLDARRARFDRASKIHFLPSNQIWPLVRCSTAVIWRTKVDLPAPLSPMDGDMFALLRSSKFARPPAHARRQALGQVSVFRTMSDMVKPSMPAGVGATGRDGPHRR